VLLRQIPFYVDGGLNVVDVRDVANGHLLADKKGRLGERYLLGGRNFTLARLFADIGRISDVPPPPVKVPLRPTIAAAEVGRRVGFPVPITEDELLSAAQWWTYRSTKAKKELGFKPRPHEETLEDAVRWQVEQLGERVGRAPRTDIALRGFGRLLQLGQRVGLG
jgi:dihydroflavonol-4-reductase